MKRGSFLLHDRLDLLDPIAGSRPAHTVEGSERQLRPDQRPGFAPEVRVRATSSRPPGAVLIGSKTLPKEDPEAPAGETRVG